MIDIEKFIQGLRFQNGIWLAAESGEISYPADANNSCYEIEDKSFWFKNRNKIIYEVIKSYSITGPIFDVGGGNGFVSEYLGKKEFDAVLIEPGKEGCINGKERGLKYIINSKIDNIHFYPNNIPNIGIFDVLEHIDNQADFLKVLHNNLASGGRLFITVPAFKFLWSAEDNHAGHYRRYSINGLHKLINNCGFDVLYASYFFSFLIIPVFLFRVIPSKLGFYKISARKTKSQHLINSNIILNPIMKFEVNRVRRGKSILFGSSLILVAKKR